MPPLELPLTIMGRRLRPVALGLALWCAAVLSGYGGLHEDAWGMVVAVAVVGALLALVVGWVRSSAYLEEIGLLLVMFAALSNLLDLLFGPAQGAQGRILASLGIAIIAGGSYLLERLDPTRYGVGGRRAA